MGESAAFLRGPDTKSESAAWHAPRTDASAARRVAIGRVPSGRGHLSPSRVPVGPSEADSSLRAPVSSPLHTFDFSRVPVRAPSEPGGDRPLYRLSEESVPPGVLAGGRVHPHIEAAIDAAHGAGQSLEPTTRQQLAAALGDSLSDVRVHADAGSGALARALSARAFTVGTDVFFADAAYRPGTPAGDALIAHEAAHVVQERGAPARGALTVPGPGDTAERAAQAAASAITGGASIVSGFGLATPWAACRGRTLARALPGEEAAPPQNVLVPPAAQTAANPILSSMKIDAPAFYRGEVVTAEIATEGNSMTVFFQLKEGRLRAGIFSIKVPQNTRGAFRAFGKFRSTALELGRAVQVPEVELMGAAVHNKEIEGMLLRQGFTRSEEVAPELGGLPGEKVEVFSKRFPVKSAAIETPGAVQPPAPGMTPSPAEEPPGPTGTGLRVRTGIKAGGTPGPDVAAPRTLKPPTGGRTSAGATGVEAGVEAGLGLEFAAAAAEMIIFWAVQAALEWLKEQVERERMERDMEALRPQIEAQLNALDSKI